MQWRKQIAVLLGASSPFAIAASTNSAAEPLQWQDQLQAPEAHKDLLVFIDPAQQARLIRLADHSSHSSHSSHASGSGGHSSHYSGSTYSAPSYSAPTTDNSASPTPKPSSSSQRLSNSSTDQSGSTASQSAKSGPTTEAKKFTKDELSDIVQKVQIALIVRGFDPGPVNGVYGVQLKKALGQFQAANGLPVSNLMDLKTLKLLNVVQ